MKKESIKNKKVTIDDLAVMIAKGFEETNDLARMVAKGFESVDREVGEVKKDINKFKNEVDKRFDGIEDRLGNVEESIQTVRGDILSLGDRSVQRYEFEDLRTRFNRLEQKVKEKK